MNDDNLDTLTNFMLGGVAVYKWCQTQETFWLALATITISLGTYLFITKNKK